VASPFGRTAKVPADGDAVWHIGRGPDTKSPLWRVGCWLIGLAAVAICLRIALWVLGGSAPFQLLISGWLILLVSAGVLMTVPYGLTRLRGGQQYRPPRDAFVIVPQKLSTVLWVMVFWRSLLSVGDELMTRVWNAATRRWIAAHPAPVSDPLEDEIRASVDNDPGWWAREP
jgi:hypothetical protein